MPSFDKILHRLTRLGLTVGGVGYLTPFFVYTVDGGESAVMFNRFGGISKKTISEGSHIKIPWFQRPVIYDIRTRPKVISTTTGTKDLQMVNISLRLLFRPNEDKLPTIHQQLGKDYEEKVLPSIGNEILKAVVARYDAENLLTQRDRVSKDIQEAITKRAKQFDITLEDVAITHLAYGNEFSRAIEEKQVAQQEAERLKFLVMKAEEERKAAVVRAEGEAEAAKMISEAIKEYGSTLIALRRIETAKEIATTLASSKNVTYISGNSNSGLLLNVKTD